MSAEILREAAREMRARAEKAEQGRWKLWGVNVMADPKGTSDLEDAIDVAFAHTPSWCGGHMRTWNADHIASWHPAVALAVADWLESEVSRAEFRERQQRETNAWLREGVPPYRCYYDTQTEKAIALANEYLGKGADA